MSDFRLAMFLFGAILFLIPKVVNSIFPDENPKDDSKIKSSTISYFFMGAIFLMFPIGDIIFRIGTNNLTVLLSQYYEILPFTYLVLISTIFLIGIFIKPTKNSLLATLLSGAPWITFIILSFFTGLFYGIFSYSEYLGIIIGLIAGIISFILINNYLEKKKPDNNEVVFSLEKLGKILNNKILLVLLLFLSILEVWLQFQGTTLIYFFSVYFI
ncbi:MAG: hypothetical protein ACTSVY_01550 [Candidatus Helarchaeota archaeon]